MANSFSITLTPDQINTLSAKFGDAGTLPETDGVILSYASDRTTGAVRFNVVKKPMLLPMSVIVSHVEALIGK
jgi:hypothetical protein